MKSDLLMKETKNEIRNIPVKSSTRSLKRKLINIAISVLVIPLIIYSCIFPFEPKITKYENVLVVDGLLTNLPNNCFVKLTRTYPYNANKYSTEDEADVRITDNSGNEIRLLDNKNGLYLPADSGFSGVVGRKYKVTVKTSSGEVCESGFEELKEPVDIDNIYYQFSDNGNGRQGLQILINTYDRQKKSFYYSWDYAETWEFWVPYISMSDYLPEMKICYKDFTSRKISIESTKNYIDDKVSGFPLYFVDNKTNRLSSKYSVLVRQYVLTEKTYQFYRDLKDINENTGTLFDRTPVILVGNMVNTLNPKQPVLGNFQVSGASEKRIFIYRSDLPSSMIVTTEYEFCESDLLSKKRNLPRLDSLLRVGWVVMDTIYEPEAHDTLIGVALSRACFDCTVKGKLKKPDFWDEQ
jgi:hypothetical protein